MADCKVCGAWFSSSGKGELCPTCERALKRLEGFAVPVVRCKDCKWAEYGKDYDSYCNHWKSGLFANIKDDDFCSYGERKDDGNA